MPVRFIQYGNEGFSFSLRNFSISSDIFRILVSSSDDKKGVSVWAELVVLLKGSLICLHDILISAECSYRHQHSRTWSVEVRYYCIRNCETVWREDELVCPSVVWVYLVVGGYISLQTSDCGYADCEDLSSVSLCLVDGLCCFWCDDESFRVHLVL